MSLHELAAELNVSDQTIYDLRSQGRGPKGFRVGRCLRFRRSGRSRIDFWIGPGIDAARTVMCKQVAPSTSDSGGSRSAPAQILSSSNGAAALLTEITA